MNTVFQEFHLKVPQFLMFVSLSIHLHICPEGLLQNRFREQEFSTLHLWLQRNENTSFSLYIKIPYKFCNFPYIVGLDLSLLQN